MSFAVLQQKINEKKNPTVIGLDPKLEFIPKRIISDVTKEFGATREAAGEAIFRLNKEIIDGCFDLIPAIKPQSAYYEMYGLEGLKALWRTVEYAKTKGLYIILDGKRNDIGATAEAYSAAYLGGTEIFGVHDDMLNADALTVNPYFGIDGIKPFTDLCQKYNKAIFVLVKTSNKSSGDFQDIIIKEENIPLYEHVAKTIMQWGKDCKSNGGKFTPIGAVIGATYPEQLVQLRAMMKDTFLLIPGYGAQGGAAKDIKGAFDDKGEGAIVNSSRAIMCAYMKKNDSDEDVGKWAREEVINMRDSIAEVNGFAQ